MSRLILGMAAILTLVGTVPGYGQAPAPWHLVEHTVATGLRGGYHVVAADINHDARVDLLAVATGPNVDLVWFENPLSADLSADLSAEARSAKVEARSAKVEDWTRYVMASGFPGMINADAFDTDKDGYPEIVLQSGFSTVPAKGNGVMTMLTRGADVTAPWTAKQFDRMPSVHRARWIDAEGNGRKMVVNAPLAGLNGAPPDYKDKVSLYAYHTADLKRQTITDAEEGVVHGLQIVDWDGKGREALLSASFLGIHLHRFNNGTWQRTRLTAGNPDPWPKNGSSDVVVLRTKPGRQLASIEPWHGNQVVVYRGTGETWDRRTVIDDTLNDGHTLVAGDLDGDGVDEIVAGYRGGGGGVNIYRLGANDQWTKHVVAAPDQKSMAAAGCVLAHLNNDRRLDLACIGTSTANLKWYENRR